MNTAVINIKTDTKTKKAAQKIAEDFGVSLSSLVTMSLRQIIRNKRLDVSLIPEEKPTASEEKLIAQGLKEYANGRYVSASEL